VFQDFLYSTSLPAGINLIDKGYALVRNYVQSIYQTVLQKDIISRYQINDLRSFENVFKYVVANIGSEVSPGRISKALKQDNKSIHNQTVQKYLEYLVNAFVLYKVHRFDIKGKEQLATQEKYYLSDIGFRNALIGKGTSQDRGHLLENVIYLELIRRGYTVWIGKMGNRQVDFVTQDAEGTFGYYQVAWTLKDYRGTEERELSSLGAIRDNYPKTLITLDVEEGSHEGIKKVNALKWLLESELRECR
jgi:predicted AAA+ superfamily ATPase